MNKYSLSDVNIELLIYCKEFVLKSFFVKFLYLLHAFFYRPTYRYRIRRLVLYVQLEDVSRSKQELEDRHLKLAREKAELASQLQENEEELQVSPALFYLNFNKSVHSLSR